MTRQVPPSGPKTIDYFRAQPLSQRLSLACFAIFVILSILVQLRWLFGLDLAVARAAYTIDNPSLAMISQMLSIAFSGELSLIYAGVLCLLLWRRGAGIWALAPLAFLPVVALEVVLKYLITQSPVPFDLYREIGYPLATVTLRGSFPSGHAARGAFFIGYFVALWQQRGGVADWLAPTIGVIAGVIIGFSRVYLGVHWLSDVVAGLLLGAPVGYGAARLISERLARPRPLDQPIRRNVE